MKSNNFLTIAILLTLSAWAMFYKLGTPNFYHLRNESRRARIAQEMLDTGNWIVPQIEDKATLTKPPLYYWAVMLCSEDRVTEFSARLPSAAAGVGTIICTYLIGCLLFNMYTGIISALALASTNLFLHHARQAEMDSMLTLFVTAAIYFFLKGYYDRQKAWLWFTFGWTMMGLGMITKGPFAVTFPLIPIVGYLWIYGELKLLREKRLLAGLIFFFLVILPWTFAVMQKYPKFLSVVLNETIGRPVTGAGHRELFYFYFKKLPKLLFPWVFFFPIALSMVFSRSLTDRKRGNIFVLLWLFGNLLFLSILRTKRDFYILPLAPAAALLIGSTWQAIFDWVIVKARQKSAAFKKITFCIGALCAAAAFAEGSPFAVNIPDLHFPKTAPFLLFAGTYLMAIVCAKALCPLLELRNITLACTVLLMFTAHYLFFTFTAPIRNVEDSGKLFYRASANIVPEKTPLGFLSPYENYAFTFYAQRSIATLKDIKECKKFMSSNELRYVTMSEKNLNKLLPVSWTTKLTSVHSEHKSWGGYVLLCNK